MVTTNKFFEYALRTTDNILVSIHHKPFTTECTFKGYLSLRAIAEFICKVNGKSDITSVFHMETLLVNEDDYVYEVFHEKPCTTIFID